MGLQTEGSIVNSIWDGSYISRTLDCEDCPYRQGESCLWGVATKTISCYPLEHPTLPR